MNLLSLIKVRAETDSVNNYSSLHQKERIGIYGGAFDPVHAGHLVVAKAALSEARLDRLLFVPTVEPPHKSCQTSYDHRLAMLREVLAERQEPAFQISTIEEKLPKPSFTINTVKALLQYQQAEYFFVIGIDAFLDIETWAGYKEILSLVSFVISPRKGFSRNRLSQLMARLGYAFVAGGWQHLQARNILFLKTVPPLVSSSEIKAKLQEDIAREHAVLPLLSPGVLAYIDRYGLYNQTGK